MRAAVIGPHLLRSADEIDHKKSTDKINRMTTFWLSFTDPKAAPDGRFLGVAIFDIDESRRKKLLSTRRIVKEAWRLGINPGGQVLVQELPQDTIPDQYKGQLITDEALLMRLGSKGRANSH
jgi:hypothetical protein